MVGETEFKLGLERRVILQELLDLPHLVSEWIMQDVQLELAYNIDMPGYLTKGA